MFIQLISHLKLSSLSQLSSFHLNWVQCDWSQPWQNELCCKVTKFAWLWPIIVHLVQMKWGQTRWGGININFISPWRQQYEREHTEHNRKTEHTTKNNKKENTKLIMSLPLKTSLHLKCVATLPCDISGILVTRSIVWFFFTSTCTRTNNFICRTFKFLTVVGWYPDIWRMSDDRYSIFLSWHSRSQGTSEPWSAWTTGRADETLQRQLRLTTVLLLHLSPLPCSQETS